MEHFVVGFLSAIVIIFLIAFVVGIVMLVKIKKQVESNKTQIDVNEDYANRRVDMETLEIYRQFETADKEIIQQIENEVRELKSFIDSRINKLENKIKE